MNLFTTENNRLTYHPETLQAIRDCPAGGSVEIGGWLQSSGFSGYSDALGVISTEAGIADLFDYIQSRPYVTVTLLVEPENVGRVREVWLRTEYVTGKGDGPQFLSNVRLCFVKPGQPSCDEWESFCITCGPLCDRLLIRVGDAEPVEAK